MKLQQDFGVRALFGCLLLIGFYLLAFYLAIKNQLPKEILMMLSHSIAAVVGFYFGTSSKKEG